MKCKLCDNELEEGVKRPSKDELTGVCYECRQHESGFDYLGSEGREPHNEMKDRRTISTQIGIKDWHF